MFKDISVEAKKENFDTVLAFVEETLEEAGCPMGLVAKINICFEEIYVNIANYAYSTGLGDGMAYIGIEADGDPLTISITFKDSGIPYNPLEKEDPDVTLSAEERKIGGLGIFMVKNMMDSVEYRYEDGHNILTITKKAE